MNGLKRVGSEENLTDTWQPKKLINNYLLPQEMGRKATKIEEKQNLELVKKFLIMQKQKEESAIKNLMLQYKIDQ